MTASTLGAVARTTRVRISMGLASERRRAMTSWLSLMRCTPARPDCLGRDHADPLEIPEGLLDSAQTVAAGECWNAPARQRRPGAQHYREHCAACSRHQATEGLTESPRNPPHDAHVVETGQGS